MIARTASDSISRMPRAIRDAVSRALADGATWRRVARVCADGGFPGVTAQNVTNYRKGAHQEWLRREERLEAVRRESEVTAAVMRHYAEHGGTPAEAGLLTAAEMLAGAVGDLSRAELSAMLKEKPEKVLGVMSQLARVAETVAKLREGTAAAEADAGPRERRALTAEERRQIEEAGGLL